MIIFFLVSAFELKNDKIGGQDFIPKSNEDEKMKQTTPLTVRYPTPRSQAPNAILIATPPDTDDFYTWTDEKISYALAHTLQLMQARMTTSQCFSNHNTLGLFLPMLYSFNPYGKDYYDPYKSEFMSLSQSPGDFAFINDPQKSQLAQSLSLNNTSREGEDS